jgi:isoleucyl-tRNA synthetase
VHLELFPEADGTRTDAEARALVAEALDVRSKIAQRLETAQKAGEISGTLEARVTLTLPEGPLMTFAEGHHDELEELFVLSDLVVVPGPEVAVAVAGTPHARCERCWRHRADVGGDAAHPTLCGRCVGAVGA